MTKTIKKRFIDYMNAPAKPISNSQYAWCTFFIYTTMWAVYGYISMLLICAVVILPIQLIVGAFKWIFG